MYGACKMVCGGEGLVILDVQHKSIENNRNRNNAKELVHVQGTL